LNNFFIQISLFSCRSWWW